MKKKILILIYLILFASGVFYFIKTKDENATTPNNTNKKVENTIKSLAIILSPHFDDGVFSLGGLIAKRENDLLVATFFTERPTKVVHTNWDRISGFSESDEAMLARTKENEKALMPFNAIIRNYGYLDFQYRKENESKNIRENITQDIETLIKTYQNREIFLYGPATFGLKITHPDHQIVHDAFMDIWKKNKTQNVHFFIYEDFPYVLKFAKSDLGTLNTYLEKKESMKFTEYPIELNKNELSEKINSIYAYESQVKAFRSLGDDIGILAQKFFQERCKTLLPWSYACEVVHK